MANSYVDNLFNDAFSLLNIFHTLPHFQVFKVFASVLLFFEEIQKNYNKQPHNSRKRRRSKIAVTPYQQLYGIFLC